MIGGGLQHRGTLRRPNFFLHFCLIFVLVDGESCRTIFPDEGRAKQNGQTDQNTVLIKSEVTQFHSLCCRFQGNYDTHIIYITYINIYIYITYIYITMYIHTMYIYICIFLRPLLVASFSSQTIPTRQRWQVSPMSSPASFSLCIPAEDGDAMGKMIVVKL